MLNGRVVNSVGAGVDGASVAASSATTVSSGAITAGGGYYSISMAPDPGNYTVKASQPGFKGSASIVVSSTPTSVPNIVMAVDPDYDPDLIFSAYSSTMAAGAPWAAACPAGSTLVPMNAPGVKSFGGVQWGSFDYPSGQGFRFEEPAVLGGAYDPNAPIPINGLSIVTAVKPKYNNVTGNWCSIVDLFCNEVTFEMRGANGRVGVRLKNNAFVRATTANAVPDGQSTILSLVVQPNGAFKVWANGSVIISNTPATPIDMTALFPGGSLANAGGQAFLAYARFMNIGRNNPDTWSAFNGFIGDTYVYKVALSDAQRLALEAKLTTKFITGATLSYTITASAGANASITPIGTSTNLQGLDKTYTLSANAGFIVPELLVDGISVPVPASLIYTFTNVSTNHTIVANAAAWPDQTITASVPGSGGTISPLGATTVVAGTSPIFAMLPADGYRIADVLVDGVSVGAVSTYTFNRVIATHTISASFAPISMNIPRTDQLQFSLVTDALPGENVATGDWPSYVPTNPMGGLSGSVCCAASFSMSGLHLD